MALSERTWICEHVSTCLVGLGGLGGLARVTPGGEHTVAQFTQTLNVQLSLLLQSSLMLLISQADHGGLNLSLGLAHD